MPTFVVLLRGINVGKAKHIPMEELRALLNELGYTKVATLLNSDNAVFQAAKGTSAKHASEIAEAIASKLQIEVPVIVKSAKEFACVVSEDKLATNASDHSCLLVAFVRDSKTVLQLEAIKQLVSPPEKFVMGSHAAYLHCVTGILESKAGEAILSKAGKVATTRNWATVLKLQTLVSEAAA